MQADLGTRLDTVGIQSQPEVAVRLLQIGSRPDAQINDFVKIIRTDHALSGRVLKLANSAFFAQRQPVTNVDRACVVLGLERLKCVSMGFYLARAMGDAGDRELTRRTWGHSLLRACLASQAAKVTAPANTAEAFVIGLMLDSGIPVMSRLLRATYATLLSDNPSPGKLYARESDSCQFTHVDVVAVLARKWRFPALLARPIELHHSKPADPPKTDPVSRLHRIAYVVGLIDLEPRPQLSAGPDSLTIRTPGITTAQRVLGLSDHDLTETIARTVSEYALTVDLFADIASRMENVDSVLEQLHTHLTTMVDDQVASSLHRDELAEPMRLRIAGQTVELCRDKDGVTVAFLFDSRGQRLLTHRLAAGAETPESVCSALGLELTNQDEAAALDQGLRALAA